MRRRFGFIALGVGIALMMWAMTLSEALGRPKDLMWGLDWILAMALVGIGWHYTQNPTGRVSWFAVALLVFAMIGLGAGCVAFFSL
jgi:hypothetical protein